MENLNLLDEAVFRLNQAGFSEQIAQTLKSGVLPVDLRGIKLPISTEQVFELAGQLEGSADVVVYGAVAVNYKDRPAVAYLMISKNPEEWRFDHELYKDKFPYCFVADLENPDESTEGYLELVDSSKTRLYQLVPAA